MSNEDSNLFDVWGKVVKNYGLSVTEISQTFEETLSGKQTN